MLGDEEPAGAVVIGAKPVKHHAEADRDSSTFLIGDAINGA
jgi:hypothetical protein